jgi:hypothetical protein
MVDTLHPRDDVTVVETNDDLGSHPHVPRDPFHDAHDVGSLTARWHEVNDADAPLRRFMDRFQNQCPGPVATFDASRLGCWGEKPSAMLWLAKHRRETGAGIKAGKTAPIDGAGAVHERRRLQVTEERVVRDASCRAHRMKRSPRRVRILLRIGYRDTAGSTAEYIDTVKVSF